MSEDHAANFEPTKRQWVGYWSMIVQQTQNAFNDKVAQFILIPLGGAVGMAVESWAGMLIALPFVVFAPIAGWLSDRYSKRDVMLGAAVLQLAVLAWICGAVMIKNLPLALCGFFALAAQAAFFGPAKMGINKELVGSKHLGFATGFQQMTAMLALLIGQIVAGWWFDHRYHALGGTPVMAWKAALSPLILLTLSSVTASLLAWIIPRVPAQGSQRFSWKLSISHFVGLRDLWRVRRLRQASFGVAFFWGFAAFINLWSVKLAKVMTGGGEGFGTLSSEFMAAASLGMAAGFGFASFLLRKRIELGWVPLAGMAMTLLSLVIVWVPVGGILFMIVLAVLAFAAALFLAPLNAWLQDNYPADKRGELQASVNLQDCFGGIIAVVIIAGFEHGAHALGIDPLTGFRMQMLFIAGVCLWVTLWIVQVLPADLLRMLGVALVRSLYRIRSVNSERLPASGGVLLLPNHVSYADAFMLTAASPRQIRFVMEDVFADRRSIELFTRIFDTMTIRRDQPLEAIREMIRALQQGDVVCLFPEGQLTRTGTLCPLQRGFELIARKSGHPIVPVWMDGIWGSVFSFERNCFFGKWPRRGKLPVTVAFGQPVEPKAASLAVVKQGMFAASVEAMEKRFSDSKWSTRRPGSHAAFAKAFEALSGDQRQSMWQNGHQVGMVNALQWGHVFHGLKDDPALEKWLGLSVAYPELFGASLKLETVLDGKHTGVWVGGDRLREQMIGVANLHRGTVFYDFSAQALAPIVRDGLEHYPCLAIEGRVIAMSMPHPPEVPEGFEAQLGHKSGTWGRLLPGWVVCAAADGRQHVHGFGVPDVGLPLPDGCVLDDEGFLVG